MFSPFAWLRNAAKNAVLSGIGDALVESAPPDATPPLSLEQLQQRLALPPVQQAAQTTVAEEDQPRARKK